MIDFDWLEDRLDDGDDPALWRSALSYILAEAETGPDRIAEVGRSSHWLRPHQFRWTADGGFAWPVGYGGGGGGYSRVGLPQFDWSIVLKWDGVMWELAERDSTRHALRLTIPARTSRHRQAAVHTLWHVGREKEVVFYGFRMRESKWILKASASLSS